MMILDDTIAAISTPPGEGGIGVVRVSGPGAIGIAEALFRPDAGEVRTQESHRVRLGRVWDSVGDRPIDRALLTLFRAPKSYTGEDVAELSCHGGSYLLSRVLEATLRAGARLAEPGEFTLRAFLRGRLDLSQAEAVLDLIRARTDASLRLAEGQLEGRLSTEISRARTPLRDLLAQIEASLDFPEDVPEPEAEQIGAVLRYSLRAVETLLATADQGRILREGAKVVIVGRPNVGKSSVMNALLREARAIVTPISGTTRDVLEESANLRGIPIRAIDTAGIRTPRGRVEALGIERAKEQLAEADLVLLVVDASRRLSVLDREIMAELAPRRLVVALNKSDLPSKVNPEEVLGALNRDSETVLVRLSAETGEGLSNLEEALVTALGGSADQLGDSALVANLRHRDSLRRASESLSEAVSTLEAGEPIDLLSVDLTAALEALGEITGESIQEELLEQIFSQFCIGK